MEQPKSDPFEHGRQVGAYVGLQQAIVVLEDALSARDEADAKL